jgi:glycosyltransferase involved in cell wall biosynthesis
MLTIAYLANEFPSPVEPYVVDEIAELRRRGIRVVTGSVRASRLSPCGHSAPDIVLLRWRWRILLQAASLCIGKLKCIAPLIPRILFLGKEGAFQRVKALVHTLLGACYAVQLQGRGVEHIHVHHGYFGSWIGMTAARFLGTGFSMTLHGSDLLLHGAFLDVKLAACTFCATVSEYNRQFILPRYPNSKTKVVVTRMGVEIPNVVTPPRRWDSAQPSLNMLSVGRLHAVKDHAFLVRACARLAAEGVRFHCSIAGDGPERRALELLIQECGLNQQVTLLGHVAREHVSSLYEQADIVVLTSRSEGIPLVLMEAMAQGKIVVAPAITGIPELVIPGRTGFLYEPGSMDDFVGCVLLIRSLLAGDSRLQETGPTKSRLDWIRHAARVHVQHSFNRGKNLQAFVDLLLERVTPQGESVPDENLVLQQI